MFASGKTAAVASAANYIEDVFSTYLYTGNGSTQTITNGIDLSTKGGLVWIKTRSAASDHVLSDSQRGVNFVLSSNLTSAQDDYGSVGISAFTSSGFSVGASSLHNENGRTFASWTFRKQPKFFDVVTYTGNGSSSRAVSHNLGSVPGCMIVKKTSASGTDWSVYHRSLGNGGLLLLNDTIAAFTSNSEWAFTTPTSTEFYVNGVSGDSNANGATYVAYLFAHDAGGFGLTGTDNVISCGSYTGNGSSTGPTITLGYEPQWVLIKNTSDAYDWQIYDVMRGMANSATGSTTGLSPNTSAAEVSRDKFVFPTATGFGIGNGTSIINQGGGTMIYIAIRRGPMKVPTSGTSVFAPVYASSASSPYTVTTNFPVDLAINRGVDQDYQSTVVDRLRGSTTTSSAYLLTDSTAAEANSTGSRGLGFQNNTAIIDNSFWSGYGLSVIYWNFRRAPSFFDEVCYTGTGSTPQNINHNLGVAPELIIVKVRSVSGDDWVVYCSKVTDANIVNLRLNKTQAIDYNGDIWDATTPTATTFRVGQSVLSNYGSQKLVAYLFATCAGVSKVGSYTGTGTTKQVDCGFTGGARFVLIKRTDSTGSWYVWDVARGISSGNDPYLLLNSTAAEVTNTDYIDAYSAGFEISSTAPAEINASGGSFIFLAIS